MMAGRARNTKKLAQRINLNYFKQLFPIPRWRRILAIGLTLIALLWLGWEALSGKQQPYNAGPVSAPHALFGAKCETCHAANHKITEQACLACHDAPIHHATQTFTPRCAECHVEHQGGVRLTATSERACTQCHATFKIHISNFNRDHPEFAPRTDPGAIKLNHQLHLQKPIRGPHGLVQMQCVDCHRSTGAPYMQPIHYQQHCAACHPLEFDKRFTEPAPHKSPEVIREYLIKTFTTYIAAHPSEVHAPSWVQVRLPSRPLAPLPRNASEWIAQRVADSEQLLWQKTCKECHPVTFPVGPSLPLIPKTSITARWLQHAAFDHESHLLIACTECHKNATTSRETSDVLLPTIQVCRECHRSGPQAAESRCFECHAYHDWSKEKQINTARKVSDLK
jgi:hypothetical protein